MLRVYEEFLLDNEILPLNNWNTFESDHKTEMTKGTRNLHTINIRNQGKNIAGIYIYFYDNICLYVGESGNLGSRFKDHYNSSWRKPKLERRMARHLFFKEYREVLSVKWIEVDNEFDRRVIEGMLTRLLKPTYIEFRKNRRKSVKITYQ